MKKVIITWASSWLWECFVDKFLAEWYEVIGLCRRKSDKVTYFFPTDFNDEASITSSITSLQEFTNIDCVVCCAAIWEIEWLDEIDFKKTQEVFQVNISWQNFLLSGIQDILKKSNSDIVFIWATIWYKANKFMPFYSITKWALRGMIENWREFFKWTTVRVIWIHPGWLETQSNVWEWWREHKIAALTGWKIPKLMNPKDIANFVFTTTQLPKNIEISEMIINRK